MKEVVQRAMDTDPNFRAFVDSGASERVARLISMAYLEASIYNAHVEEAVGIMDRYGFIRKKFKTAANNLTQSFDVFANTIAKCINDKEAQKQFIDDFEYLKDKLDEVMEVELKEMLDKYMNSRISD